MNHKKKIKIILIICLFCLALGGWLLHLRIHTLAKSDDNIIPLISGIISVFCLPVLFWFSSTLTPAYIINGFLAIIGTIIMTQYTIVNFNGPLTPVNIILNSTFADIAILWGKFATGMALFELKYLKSDSDTAVKGRFFRYPNMGWWWVHLIALAMVYTIGNILWK